MNHSGIISSAMNATRRGGLGVHYLPCSFDWGHLFRSIDNYDNGVYFSAAQHLFAGVLRYRDFVFAHPPGVMLLLAPIASLVQFIGDNWAFVIARFLVTLIGATSAVLVAILLRSYGRAAALAGGMLYPC